MKGAYDILANGVVVNTIVATEDFVKSLYGAGNYSLNEDYLASIQVARIVELQQEAADKEGQDWELYREALFNLPNDKEYPYNVTWPTKP